MDEFAAATIPSAEATCASIACGAPPTDMISPIARESVPKYVTFILSLAFTIRSVYPSFLLMSIIVPFI